MISDDHLEILAASGITPEYATARGYETITEKRRLADLKITAAGRNVPGPFAKLCGVCPLEASSGKTIRHRLNRGGNRDANRALHVILVVRLRRHQPTRDYMARRTAEGKSKNEVMRCLKRYIAREVFNALQPPPTTPKTIAAT